MAFFKKIMYDHFKICGTEGGCMIWPHLYHGYPESKQIQRSKISHKIPGIPGLLLLLMRGIHAPQIADPLLVSLSLSLSCPPILNFFICEISVLYMPVRYVETSQYLKWTYTSYLHANAELPLPGFLNIFWAWALVSPTLAFSPCCHGSASSSWGGWLDDFVRPCPALTPTAPLKRGFT